MNERIEQATREYVDNLVNSRDGSSYSIHQKRLAARFDAYDLEECVCNIVEVLLSHQWISIDEKLPEEYEDVLVRFIYHEKSVVSIGRYSDMGEWMVNGFGFLEHITHWMKIPTLEGGEE